MIEIISINYAECFDMQCSKSYEIFYFYNEIRNKVNFVSNEILTKEEITSIIKLNYET